MLRNSPYKSNLRNFLLHHYTATTYLNSKQTRNSVCHFVHPSHPTLTAFFDDFATSLKPGCSIAWSALQERALENEILQKQNATMAKSPVEKAINVTPWRNQTATCQHKGTVVENIFILGLFFVLCFLWEFWKCEIFQISFDILVLGILVFVFTSHVFLSFGCIFLLNLSLNDFFFLHFCYLTQQNSFFFRYMTFGYFGFLCFVYWCKGDDGNGM